MSASLNATRALLKAKGIRFKQEISPHTGQMAIYAENTAVAVVPASATIDVNTLKTKITDDLASNSIDGNCDYVGFIGMTLSKTYYPRVWVNTAVNSSGQLVVLDTNGQPLVAPLVIAAIILASIAVIAVTVAYTMMWMFDNSFTYYDPNSQSYKTIIGATNFQSTMNSLYWYTCPKDGTGIGLKTQYATLAQYQASPNYASEKAYLEDHCATANDIIGSKLSSSLLNTIVLGALVVGGIYIVAKILPSFLSRKGAS